jgi:integrase/recombinase XerD
MAGALVPIRRTAAALAEAATEQQLTPWLGNYESPSTRDAYHRDAILWDDWCRRNNVGLLSPSPGDVTSWADERRKAGDSDATVVRRVSSVLTFYKWARHEGITTVDPTPFKRPTVHRDDVDNLGLTKEEFAAVRAHAGGSRNFAFVTLLGYCGLRVSEALNGNVEEIREQSGHRVIRVVGKGKRPRTVPIPPKPYDAVAAYLDGRAEGPIFCTRTGNRWVRRDAWKAVQAIGVRAGIPDLHPHTFRHTAATLMLEAGEPLDKVQLVLGHASPETTMKYAKARDRLDGSAVYGLARYLAED